jgi:CheY-like chemotaxis protein
LLNLCLNARDAMNGQGVLTVSTNIVAREELKAKFPAAAHNSYVTISVTDTGEGMEPETLRRIFEPFFTTKERGKGTGLGLSVVYGIVDAHGGLIDVQSTLNAGSTFQLFFPVSDQITLFAEEDAQAPQPSAQGTGTILVAEDEPALRTMMARLLKDHGYEVLSVGDGKQGLELFKQQSGKIDLVITDIDMPRLDGSAMIRELKNLKSDLPIIVMSGYLDPELRALLQALGVAEFCQKPFTPNNLLRVVRKLAGEG